MLRSFATGNVSPFYHVLSNPPIAGIVIAVELTRMIGRQDISSSGPASHLPTTVFWSKMAQRWSAPYWQGTA